MASMSALWLLLLLTAMEAFSYYTLSNVLTLHLTDVLGISDVMAGTHFGLRGTATMLCSTLAGPVIDMLGSERILPFAFVLSATGRAAFALATSSPQALLAMYVPMAAGHGMTNAAITICVKRATSLPGGPSAAWGFAMQYCALVLGIALCGPTIDIVTAAEAPNLPYRKLELLSAACSALGIGVSAAYLHGHAVSSSPLQPNVASAASAGDFLRRTLCTRRFGRFAAFSIAILPGCMVIRNLDGGIFPKFMLRTFGPHVSKGTIYALNPLIDLFAVPLVSVALRERTHFELIRAGLTFAAFSPLAVAVLGPSIPSVISFVVLLTIGDFLYNPRLQAYAMAVAPDGREGSFAGAMHAVAFLAELPAGLLGGWLVNRHCSEADTAAMGPDGCNATGLFGQLALFALTSPVLLWTCPSLLLEPDADVSGVAASKGHAKLDFGTEQEMQPVAISMRTCVDSSPEGEGEGDLATTRVTVRSQRGA
jgi:POT family proton-dependent oligopeptide transporter